MVIPTFHIRFKPEAAPAQVDSTIDAIRGFQGTVPGLLETSIGHNFSPRSNGFHVGAAMKFESRATLEPTTPAPLTSNCSPA